MARSLQHVVPSHLGDRSLFDFAGLQATGVPDPEGDLAFDPPSFPNQQAPSLDPDADAMPRLQVVTL
jgi:tRNA 2-thiocytidine biosynthesis protein TtcA